MSISRNKNEALLKQLAFKKQIALTASGMHGKKNYEHILADKDALNGANFYCFNNSTEWLALQEWAKKDNKKLNFASNGLKNILRSEHIAYNIFYPLEKLRIHKPALLCAWLSNVLACKVDNVIEIKIEYAGEVHKSKLLNDRTSFDAFIAFESNGEKCAAGFEIKYTEGSYPYGKSEKDKLEDADSTYWQTAINSKMFELNAENKKLLISKKLKQPWRNHLLGIKMTEKNTFKRFYSVHIYPAQNTYQQQVAEEYAKTLNQESNQYFVPLTFEDIVSKAKEVGIDEDWVNCLSERY